MGYSDIGVTLNICIYLGVVEAEPELKIRTLFGGIVLETRRSVGQIP